ncbi:MAG: methyltransferase domain-containing protein [Candidatus Omnitrophota bacterium]|nr:methyltransferase domain-containing protein [Candidatus Omnitrophota bacterium]
MRETNKVKRFFDKRVNKFDSIYDTKKKLVWKVLDFIFRKSVERRFELTCRELDNIRNKKILDIGCGTGRYSVTLAQKGAFVYGIDFSQEMLNTATGFSKDKGADNLCVFIYGDFIDYNFNDKFDICLAIGFFDYIKEPIEYLKKIKNLTIERAILSFPAKWHLRNIIRRLRLKILDCPVYFYSRLDLEKILKQSGFDEFSIRNIGRDYFVIVKI